VFLVRSGNHRSPRSKRANKSLMPLTPLRISRQSELDLQTVSEQPPERLRDAYSRLAASKDHIISPKAVRGILEQSLAPDVVSVLMRQLIGLRAYIDQYRASVPDAMAALSLGIEEKKWTEERYRNWNSISSIFEQFLSLDNIVTTAKALELSFDFEHTLTDVKILTDIRPVYSPDRDKIIGGIICNRLRFKYRDEDGDKSISLAIDKDDIEQLQKMCAEARTKIELASNLLKSGGLPTFISGEGHE